MDDCIHSVTPVTKQILTERLARPWCASSLMTQAALMVHSSEHARHQLGLLKLCLLVSCSLFATCYSVVKVMVRGVSSKSAARWGCRQCLSTRLIG